MKKIIALLLSCLLMFSLAACSGGASTPPESKAPESGAPESNNPEARILTMPVESVKGDGDPYCAFSEKFKELTEEKIDGLQVDLYYGGSLGTATEVLEGIMIGTYDLSVVTNAIIGANVPQCGLFDLPFLFADSDTAYDVLSGDIGQKVLESMSSFGVKGLSYGEGGFRQLLCTDGAVRTPDDLKGLKIRSMDTQSYLDTYAELGVNAVPMSFSEILPALQQGTIDGLDLPVNVAYNNGFLSAVDIYLCMTGHFYSPIALVINPALFDSFTPEEQEILIDCAREAGKYTFEVNAEYLPKFIDELNGSEYCTVVDDVDVPAFQAYFTDFYMQRADIIGDNLVVDILNQLGISQ